MSGRKTTEIEMEKRMERVFEEVLYGNLPDNEIKKKLAKEFGVTTRTTQTMVVECRRRIKEKHRENQDEILEQQISRYLELIKTAREKNQSRVLREALADLTKIYGLEQQKIDVTSGGERIGINIILSQDEGKSSK